MKRLLFILLFLLFASQSFAARWNKETTSWEANPKPKIGDWGFDRPGYPKGLYIHGVTVKEGRRVKNPVIYDNDVYDDVFDDEWMYAMVSLGEMNLSALILTPVLTDGWGFSKPEWIETAHDSRNLALRSGISKDLLPEITVGTEAESEKAGERKSSAGAYLYVKLINEHYAKHPDLPVIINIGGQGATLASAFCIDPTIAEKCIVYYTDIRVYNGHYRWASELIAKHFRVVSWGDDNWWIRKSAQNEWNVLPRPDHALARENDERSGEWALLTDMHQPMLDHIVHQFRHRNEYSDDNQRSYADGYHDGGFIHAWLPSIFSDAELREVRGGEVLHITKFTADNEAQVKRLTMATLLNKRAYNKTKK
ncbi:MAG: hypothetical protein IKY82_03015 [Alistipes sp.]|nr:hypothetical protein [Alistipes sp.]